MQAAEYDDDPEEVRKHLSRRWVDRRNPELMPASRKRMEERYNPLIKLLGTSCPRAAGAPCP